MPKRGITHTVFIVWQLKEKYLAKINTLHLVFVGLEKDFNRAPYSVMWWYLRKLGIEMNGI